MFKKYYFQFFARRFSARYLYVKNMNNLKKYDISGILFGASLLLLVCLKASKAADGSKGLEEFFKDFFMLTAQYKWNENLVCSPVSASIILALTAFGARGKTALEIQNALRLPQLNASTALSFQHLIDQLNSARDVDIRVANLVSVSPYVGVNQYYLDLANYYFRSNVSLLQGSSSQIANDANAWVTVKTNRAITQFLKDDDIQHDTVVLLLNAISFIGKWLQPFDSRSTFMGNFYDLNNNVHNVPTMKIENGFFLHGTIPELDAQFLELPYKDQRYKMVIIYPQRQISVHDFYTLGIKLRHFDYNKLNKENYGKFTEVHYLTLPQFTIESTIDLKPILQKMNIEEMFRTTANFENIFYYALNNAVQVTKILQKVRIEVNEEGTKAAVASGVLITRRTGFVVAIMRPFYFSITSPEGPIFQGHVLLPQN